MRPKRFRIPPALMLVLVTVLTGTGLATAHGGDASLVHACVHNDNGKVRIVGSAEDCRDSERPQDWGIEGPQGPQGPEGPEGPEGPQGPPGGSGLVLAESVFQESYPAFDLYNGIRLFETTLPAGLAGHVLIVEAAISVFTFEERNISAIASVNNWMMSPPFMTQFGERCEYTSGQTCTLSALWTLDLDDAELQEEGTQFIGQPLEFYISLRDDDAGSSGALDRSVSGSVVVRMEPAP